MNCKDPIEIPDEFHPLETSLKSLNGLYLQAAADAPRATSAEGEEEEEEEEGEEGELQAAAVDAGGGQRGHDHEQVEYEAQRERLKQVRRARGRKRKQQRGVGEASLWYRTPSKPVSDASRATRAPPRSQSPSGDEAWRPNSSIFLWVASGLLVPYKSGARLRWNSSALHRWRRSLLCPACVFVTAWGGASFCSR
jgi:hypothetical protein